MWCSMFRGRSFGVTTPATRRWLATHAKPPRRDAPDRQAAAKSRLDGFIQRSPAFVRPSLIGLRQAPVSHVTAFVILHELTAVVPLVGLAVAFHYGRWLPPYFAEGAWIAASVEKFGRYFRKKGWISEREEQEIEQQTRRGASPDSEGPLPASAGFDCAPNATRWVVECATAYAIVKVLLPLRILASVWASPWFARLAVIPLGTAAKSLLRRRT